MSLALLLLACNIESAEDKAAADLQLEAATVDPGDCVGEDGCDGSDLATGALAVTRTSGDASVELEITVGDVVTAVHSPTGVDLAAYVGTEVTVAARGGWMEAMSLELRDEAGPVYVVEAGDGDAFSVIEVKYGEVLGDIVDDADYKLTFRALEVTTDDGAVSVKPGEVVTVHIDGLSYRFGAIAAYETDTIPGGEYADCGGESPMLSYELVRIEEDATFPVLVRPASLNMAAVSGCGG